MESMCIFVHMESDKQQKKEPKLKIKTSVSGRTYLRSANNGPSDEDMREMERRYDENEEFQYRFAYWNMGYTHTDF